MLRCAVDGIVTIVSRAPQLIQRSTKERPGFRLAESGWQPGLWPRDFEPDACQSQVPKSGPTAPTLVQHQTARELSHLSGRVFERHAGDDACIDGRGLA